MSASDASPPAEATRPEKEQGALQQDPGNGSPGEQPASLAATPVESDFDPIIPELSIQGTFIVAEGEIMLKGNNSSGVECKTNPVRTRELLAIGRVLTGATRPLNVYNMIAPVFEADTDAEQTAAFTAALTNLMITVPHSEREFIDLCQALVNPIDRAFAQDKDGARDFWAYMENPNAEDTIKILLQAFTNEKEQLQKLGKQLMTMFPQLRGGETTELPDQT